MAMLTDVTARVVTARRLATDLSQMAATAAALADEAVWQATRTEPAKTVARALGVSEAAVRKAVQQHNRRAAGRLSVDVRTESDMADPANGADAA